MEAVTVFSLNAKGLNVPEKRRMLMSDLHHHKANLAFIQETHFKEGNLPILKNKFYPTVYHSTFGPTKSRGVSILISRSVPWKCAEVKTDPEGRFLFIRGDIGGVEVTLANVYAPNSQQDHFIARTLDTLKNFTKGQLILGGDFNVSLIPSEDTSSGNSSVTPKARKRIARSLHNSQLIDVWRLLHPTERDYTFYSTPHRHYSRIDYFLIPHTQLHAVRGSSIGSITWSDHAPVLLSYALTDCFTTRERTWRLNESLLQDDETLKDVVKEVEYYFKTNDIPGVGSPQGGDTWYLN